MIDSISRSVYLYYCVPSCLSDSGEETRPTRCFRRQASKVNLINQGLINVSCYTECKAFGPSLIYNKYENSYISKVPKQN